MEIGSPDPSTVPSWVVVDKAIYRKDLASFRDARGATSASARASNGEGIRVSFILTALPGTSRLCLHCSERRKMISFDTVEAAHGEAVLFRLKIDCKRLLWGDNAIDYFIYWAAPSGPKLTRLPRWYMTEPEILAAEKDGSWNRSQRIIMGIRGTGLLLTGCQGEFVVAELQISWAKLEHWDAPLEGKLIRLCSDREAVTSGTAKWEVKDTTARGGKARFRDLRGWWKAHVVLPYGSYLCWVDYFRGIILCDVNHDSPDLQYLPLPLKHVPLGYPDPFLIALPTAYRAVGITKGGTMKFVNIVRDDGMLLVSSHPGSGFTITIYTLVHHGYDEMTWEEGVTITPSELWGMDGYDIQLPRITPQFPLVSMDEPSIIYFVLAPDDGTKKWVLALDTEGKKVLWNREIRAVPSDEDLEMSSYNIFSNKPFFPCQFSKYLQKANPSLAGAAGRWVDGKEVGKEGRKVTRSKKAAVGKKTAGKASFKIDCLTSHGAHDDPTAC